MRPVIALLLIAVPPTIVGCRERPSPASLPPSWAVVPATFVGREACAECHADIVQVHAGSDHDLAMQPAGETTVLGDFEAASFTAFGVTSTFFRRDGGYYVRTDGPDGALHDYRVSHTFGVRPLQQYLTEMPDGRVQALPLCWDTRPAEEGGQRWFHLYPDEPIDHRDELHWTRPLMNWNYMCAECHSTNLQKRYRADTDRYETTWSEIDVSCEACHGPGARHVAWANDVVRGFEAEPDGTRGLTLSLRVAPESFWVYDDGAPTAHRSIPLATNAQAEACGRCHSRRTQIWPEYRHGAPLADTHLVSLLDEGLYHADGQILDEVYVYGSFLQSRMYHQDVTCTDCHEPHAGTLWARGNDLCARCHQPTVFDTPAHHHHSPDTPGAQCVGCHMPMRHYMVVDPRRDHSFRVPRPDLSVELGTPNACNDCHADQSPEWAHEATLAWYGPERSDRFHYGEALHAGRTRRAGADELLRRVCDDPEAPGIARATALGLLASSPGPRTAAAIETGAGDPDPLVRRAAAEVLESLDRRMRLRVGAALLADPIRTVRLAAVLPLAVAPAEALPPGQAAAVEPAVAEYRAAQAFNADRAPARHNLGILDAQLGRFDAAERTYRAAIAVEPHFTPAYANLADLLRTAGRDAEGEDVLRAGLEVVPESAELHHALGLAQIRLGRAAEAMPHLAAAARLRPAVTRYAFVWAIALHDMGDGEAAIEVLEHAHARAEADRDVLLALVNYSLERGRRDTALQWARELAALAPDDDDVRRMLEELAR